MSVPRPTRTPRERAFRSGEHAAGEVGVRQRAVSDARPALADQREVVVADTVAVREHAAAPQQTEVAQRLGVAPPEPGAHDIVLPIALRAMRLDVAVAPLGERAEPLEQRVRAARHEARRDRRQHPPVRVRRRAAQVVDQRLGALERDRRGGVAVVRRALLGMVHRDAPDQRPLPERDAGVGEQARRRVVEGREVDGRRRAAREQGPHQGRVDGTGEVDVRVTALERKRRLLQPVLERQVQRAAELRPLRGVHVQVDQTRQEEAGAARGHRVGPRSCHRHRLRMTGRRRRRHARDRARRVHLDERVLEHDEGVRGGRVQEGAGERLSGLRVRRRQAPIPSKRKSSRGFRSPPTKGAITSRSPNRNVSCMSSDIRTAQPTRAAALIRRASQ